MLSDFAITNPFIKTTEMFTGTLDLDHASIARFMRDNIRSGKDKGYTSFFDNDDNEWMNTNLPCKEKLITDITTSCRAYAKVRNMDLDKLEDEGPPVCWFSEYLEGDRHTLHNHPRAALAGTYYPYADENSCEIRYRHPASGMLGMVEPWNVNTESFVIHKLYPKTGMINVWPSWMEHEIGPQKYVPKERSRLAISFNYGRLS